MATAQRKSPEDFIGLHNGDLMNQKEFHFNYERMDAGYKAELIGGVVFEPSPLSYEHGKNHCGLNLLLITYAAYTPSVECADNATVILGEDDEVQPDIFLRISETSGGRSRITRKGFVAGAPELVAELALTSKAIDLHLKKQRYALAGVQEYIVFCLQPKKLHWFNFTENIELPDSSDGIFRSRVYPGLWIHCDALLQSNSQQALKTLNKGMKSSEHKEFVAQLSSRTKKKL